MSEGAARLGANRAQKAQFSHHCTGLEPRNCHAGAGRCWTSAVARPRRFPQVMSTVATYSYTHSVTYVTDNILKSLKDIILLSGLDPEHFADRWES
ncbi:TPA: HORMA domain containing protein, partial [Pseudomonas aeruginosa]